MPWSCFGAQGDRTRLCLLGPVSFGDSPGQLLQSSSCHSAPQPKSGTLWCCLAFGMEEKNISACLTDVFNVPRWGWRFPVYLCLKPHLCHLFLFSVHWEVVQGGIHIWNIQGVWEPCSGDEGRGEDLGKQNIAWKKECCLFTAIRGVVKHNCVPHTPAVALISFLEQCFSLGFILNHSSLQFPIGISQKTVLTFL